MEQQEEAGNPNPFSMIGNILNFQQRQTSTVPFSESVAKPPAQLRLPETSPKVTPASPQKPLSTQPNDDTDSPDDDLAYIHNSLEKLKDTPNYDKLKAKISQLTPAQQKASIQYAIKYHEKLQKKKEDAERDKECAKVEPEVVVVSQRDIEDVELLEATRFGNIERLKQLLTKFNRTSSTECQARGDQDAHPLLHWAALDDQVETVEYLLSNGADPLQRNCRGELALHWASLRGHLRSIHTLLTSLPAGASSIASLVDNRGYSCLHHAAQFGNTDALALILHRIKKSNKQGFVDIDLRDNCGRTALHWAAYKSHELAVKFLLTKGSDLWAKDWEECTALHWSALQGDEKMCKLLCKEIFKREGKSGLIKYLEGKDKTNLCAKELAVNKGQKFHELSLQAKNYAAIGKLLGGYQKKGSVDIRKGSEKIHPTWFLWPVLSPFTWYGYYYYLLPSTFYYFGLNAVTVCSYWLVWFFWLTLQVKDPGYIVCDQTKDVRKSWFETILYCYGTPGRRKVNEVSHIRTNSKRLGRPDDELELLVKGNDENILGARDYNLVEKVPSDNMPLAAYYRELYDEVLDNGLLVPICSSCEIVKPLRSKHDKMSDKCVVKFDHYCPWIGVPIGQNNYGEFVMLLLFGTLSMSGWLILGFIFTTNWNPSQSYFANFKELLYWEICIWLFAPIALYGVLMFAQHSYMISKNITTNEVINRSRYRYLSNGQNHFSRGILKNWLEFFGIIDPVKVNIKKYHQFAFDRGSELTERLERIKELKELRQQVTANGGASATAIYDTTFTKPRESLLSITTSERITAQDVNLSTLPIRPHA